MEIDIRQCFAKWMGVFLVLGVVLPVNAAYYPSMVYGPKVSLSSGVTYQTANHASPLWSIHIVEIDMTNPNVELVPVHKQATALERTSAMAARSDAVAAFNAGFFNTASPFQSVSYTLKDGRVYSNSGGNFSAIGFTGNHQSEVYRMKIASGNVPENAANWSKVVDAIAGIGSFYNTGGVATVDKEGRDAAFADARHPRTMMGFRRVSPPRVWLVAVDGRQTALSVGMTFTEQAQFMADLGAEESINLDGGGSTTAWVRGQVVNSPSDGSERSVATAWIVAPYTTVDDADANAALTGPWTYMPLAERFRSSSPTATGPSGGSTARWSPNLAVDGRYKIHAWWTAGTNRPANAPYIVTHREGATLVPVDQRVNGGSWQLLGTFNLTAAPGAASVSISNTVEGTISADAVRFVRVSELVPRWRRPVGSFAWFQNDNNMRACTINQATGNVIAASYTAGSGGVYVLSNTDGSVVRQLGGSAAVAGSLSFTGAASTRTGKIFVTSLVTAAGTDNHKVYYWPSETAGAPVVLTGSAPGRVGDSVDAYEDPSGNITVLVAGNQTAAPATLLKYYYSASSGTWTPSTVTVTGSTATGLRSVAIKQTGTATYEIWLKASTGAIRRFTSAGAYIGTGNTPGTTLLSNYYFGRDPGGSATVEYYVAGPYSGSAAVGLFNPADGFSLETVTETMANSNGNASGGYGVGGVGGRLFVAAGITNNHITLYESAEPALYLPGTPSAVDGWEMY